MAIDYTLKVRSLLRYAFDPIVLSNQIKKIDFIPRKITSDFKDMDILLILNNHDSFFDINIIKMINKMKKCSIIFDGRKAFDQKQFDDNNNIYINHSSIKINVQ